MKRRDFLQAGEYISIPRMVLADSTLNPGDKLVLMVMIEALGPSNESAWPGPKSIADDTGMARSGVKKCLAHLKELGWLTPQGIAKGRYNTRIYAVAPGHKVTGSQSNPVTKGTGTGLQSDPGTGLQSNHKVPKGNLPKGSTEEGDAVASQAAGAAHSPRGETNGSQQTLNAEEVYSPTASAPDRSVTPKQAKPKAKAARKGPKELPLTDAEKQVITSTKTNIAGYWLFGREAVGKTPADWLAMKLTPSRHNWAPNAVKVEDFAKPEAGVTDSSLTAYAWYRLSLARRDLGISVDFKPGQLWKAIPKLREQKTSLDAVVKIIDTITGRWSDVRAGLGKFGGSLELSESVFQIPSVIEKAQELSAQSTGSTFATELDNIPLPDGYRHDPTLGLGLVAGPYGPVLAAIVLSPQRLDEYQHAMKYAQSQAAA